MRIGDMTWMQVEEYLQSDDRCVVPLGSTEQHAYLSLSVDSILAERVAVEAAEAANVPVFPVLHYGVTPYFSAYPGTISLRIDTYLRIIGDVLDNLKSQGFRRILLVSGHGGNAPAGAFAGEWVARNPDVQVQFHEWWKAPKTLAKVREIDPVASHASWMENFPWTRLDGVTMPDAQKDMIDFDYMRVLSPATLKDYLGDGNFGGYYQRSDDDMHAIWRVAVAETRDLLLSGWA